MRSLILLFCLFGLALCVPKYYSSELEGLNGDQQQDQPQQQQQQQVRVRDEAERRRLGEQLGRRVENEEEESTPRREAIVILRPVVASQQTESELYDGQDRSATPGVLLPHHTRSHKLAARFAVRRVQDVQVIPVRVQEQPQQQQQQQSGDEEETTTTEATTTTEEPSTTTEEEATTSSSTEEPSSSTDDNNNNNQPQPPQFTSDSAAVVNSRTFTTFKARKNVNGKEVTVLGRTMAFRSSAMNVLRPTPQRRDDDDEDRKDETDEERREREKAEAASKNVKIVQFSQMQAIRSSKAVITRDAPSSF